MQFSKIGSVESGMESRDSLIIQSIGSRDEADHLNISEPSDDINRWAR
jgi:hypothetical protein